MLSTLSGSKGTVMSLNEFDSIFSDLLGEVKAKERADKTVKRKDATPGDIAEANRIRQEWIDAEWREQAAGPMFARQVCAHCLSSQSMFAGWFIEALHATKRDTTRLLRVQKLDAEQLALPRVRFFREEEVAFCASPGCIEGYDAAPWKH